MLRTRYIGLLVIGMVLAVGCEHRAPVPTMDAVRAEEEPDQESWGVHFYVTEVPLGSEASRMRMEMIADYMAQYEQGDSSYQVLHSDPDSLHHRVLVHLFDAQGDASATLTADRVYYYERDKRFEAEGNVVVVTKDLKRLESEHLIWLEEERKVRTPGFVNMVTSTKQVQGYGLVADEDLATYRLGRVTAQVRVEDEE